jgi:general secretion pathway protein G
MQLTTKSEIRNPKSERSPKSEIRSAPLPRGSSPTIPSRPSLKRFAKRGAFGPSDFGLLSDFGFRASALSIRSHLRAFTLIELLLVLVILGILAAIVVPKFAGRTEQARQTAAQSQIANFGTMLDAFEVDMGSYPKGKNGLQDLVQAPRDAQNWKGPYSKSAIPNDPWGHPYVYECPGKHNPNSYDLMSIGPDGRAGTDDGVTNWTQKR